jgi:hypothetical protein
MISESRKGFERSKLWAIKLEARMAEMKEFRFVFEFWGKENGKIKKCRKHPVL